MSKARSAQIRLTGPGKGTVMVSGTELHGVRAIAVGAAVGEITRLTVELALYEAEIDGEMVVTVPPKTAATLAALGWAPPPGQPLDGPEQALAFRHSCGTLQDGSSDECSSCAGCRFEMHPDDVVQRYVLVEIGGAPDAASG